MRLKIVAAIAALLLFLAYFGPLIVKLKDLPLTIVLIGGIVLVAIDIWESLKE